MRVSNLFIYPVKSCAAVPVEQARVRPRGLEGDRRWMLVNEAGGHVTQREVGALARVKCRLAGTPGGVVFEDGPTVVPDDCREDIRVTIWRDSVQASLAPVAVAEWLRETTGRPLRLVYMSSQSVRPVDPGFGMPGDQVSFADGYPVLIVSEASVAAVDRRTDFPVHHSRFRPNIVVPGVEAFEEDGWRRVRIGDVEFDVVKPCARCVVLDTDPETGDRSPGVLRVLSAFRQSEGNVYFGQNAIARTLGEIRVGDQVRVIESGPARPAL